MVNTNLPLEEMPEEEFAQLKQRLLDSRLLTREDLDALRKATGTAPSNDGRYGVRCGEKNHSHDYRCLSFEDRTSMLIHRLVSEIESYQSLLASIRERTDPSLLRLRR